jgi:transposase
MQDSFIDILKLLLPEIIIDYFEEITVQDFPIRGHQVYLHITRRRWLNEDTGKIVFRDWNLVADGTRVTQEFASFLKEINRFQSK